LTCLTSEVILDMVNILTSQIKINFVLFPMTHKYFSMSYFQVIILIKTSHFGVMLKHYQLEKEHGVLLHYDLSTVPPRTKYPVHITNNNLLSLL